ncbi:branched-chain amino acid ABC transporter permease [Azospirillum canadense]|uniref:branched-chain amino acid ABC transporter permease n=1 Tax=Azospirillum canadense TaxID=403962 RepID=UPI0022268025|nr:branched-chain amino acid ABC transporter permease [Azospirillum canadense]MCW2239223.1 branched-chain amino acid transport system permease protein [Azospirillum canadense]
MNAARLLNRLGFYAAVAAPFVVVAVAEHPFFVQIAIGVAVSAILALAWDILSRTGQVSLGHAAFFGMGGYGSALLTPVFGPVLGWAAGILLCGAVAVLLGAVTLRLRRLYFTIATLSFSLSIQVFILVTPDLTGGSTGIMPPVIAGGSPPHQLLFITACLVVAATVSDIFLGPRFRPAFFMIRNNPHLAAASGVPVTRLKILAFAVSGMVAGLAGACYAGLYGYVIPEDVFTTNWNVLPLAVTILGGMDTTLGPIIGAVALRALEEVARHFVGGVGYQVVYGAVIILFIVGMPVGLVGFARGLVRRRRKPAAEADTVKARLAS